MLTPIQNQDLMQRSDKVSEMRSGEQGKAFGDVAKAAAEMQRLEDLKNSTVQQDEETEALNPDGSGNKKEQEQKKNKKKKRSPKPIRQPAIP